MPSTFLARTIKIMISACISAQLATSFTNQGRKQTFWSTVWLVSHAQLPWWWPISWNIWECHWKRRFRQFPLAEARYHLYLYRSTPTLASCVNCKNTRKNCLPNRLIFVILTPWIKAKITGLRVTTVPAVINNHSTITLQPKTEKVTINMISTTWVERLTNTSPNDTTHNMSSSIAWI